MKKKEKTTMTMTCEDCNIRCQRFGKHRNGLLRFRCPQCKRTYTEPHTQTLGMYIPQEKAVMVIQLLLEGNSIRSTERITGLDRNTIMKLLVLAGEKCEKLLESRIKNIPVSDVQCDEIWGFVQKKEGHKWMYESDRKDIGDAYCFTAVERNSKLLLAWHLGRRDAESTVAFIEKLRTATAEKQFQVTTDGFRPYVDAIDTALVDRVDFAQLVKVYATSNEAEHRYSPGEVAGAVPSVITGNPDPRRICTSHVERHNLSIRMEMRRMTRLTNAFSKKWDNLKAAYALWFAWYNFGRIHRTLRMTPAMEAGITDHIWTIAELLA